MNQEIKARIEQIKRGEVPQGYKKTKVGIVPSEWDETNFSKLGTYKKGREVSTSVTTPEGLPAMMYGDIYVKYDTKFRSVDYRVSETVANKSTPAYKGDLLFTCSGETALEIGKCVCYQGEETIYIGGDILALTPESTNSMYIAYQQNSYPAIVQKARLGQGHSVVHIYLNSIHSLAINLPSLPEQQKIVDILTAQDKVIELKEKLIAEKQRQKKWLMQNLLTGKKRLKGFSGEWKAIKAQEIFENMTDKTHNGELQVLSATQDKGVIPRSDVDIDIKYDVNSLSSYKKVNKGNFVISLRSFQGGIEYSEYCGIVSPAYTILTHKKEIADGFYKQFFKSADYVSRLNVAVYGIRDGKQISYTDFGIIKIPYPTLPEQTAIAEILSTADREIELLQKNIAEEKQKKKALMQLLLTGIVRV